MIDFFKLINLILSFERKFYEINAFMYIFSVEITKAKAHEQLPKKKKMNFILVCLINIHLLHNIF